MSCPRLVLPTRVITVLLSVVVMIVGCARTANITSQPAPACMGRISADTTTYRAGEWDSPPAMRRAPLIAYPTELNVAQRHRVVLRFRVLATGVVDSASIVVVSSTDARFNRYAIEGVRQTEMWPACKDGKAVASLVQQSRAFGGGEL